MVLLFKFCIHIVIGDEWYGIVDGQNPSIFNRVTVLVHPGKTVYGLLFLFVTKNRYSDCSSSGVICP